jgi:hypothetical protein
LGSAGIGGAFGTLGSWQGDLENLSVEVMGGRRISPLLAIVGEMGVALHAPPDNCTDSPKNLTCVAPEPFVSADFNYIAPAAKARDASVHLNGLHWNANILVTPTLNIKYIMPYVTAGYGGYTGSAVREADIGLFHTNTDVNPAGNVGGGVMIPVYRFVAVRADYRAYFVNGDDRSNISQFSLTVGVGGSK